MAKFLNTTGTSYHLEELIKNASERLILISPYLQFSDRIKELLEDKNRLKIDVRIVYGKTELKPAEIGWLKELDYIRTSFCKNLHAKCYLNEEVAIITSLNLYEFSQVNNNEMGVLIDKTTDSELYIDTYEEAQRIIRMSDEVRLSVDLMTNDRQASHQSEKPQTVNSEQLPPPHYPKFDKSKQFDKLTTAKLADKIGMNKDELHDKLIKLGYIEMKGKTAFLTEKGRQAGGELKKGQYGYFIVWSVDMDITGKDFIDKIFSLFGL